MGTPATKLLQSFVRSGLAPVFKAFGFSGAGRTFRRRRDEVVDVVEVELWKYNDTSRARFTVSVGACFPELLTRIASMNAFAHWKGRGDAPSLTECVAWERIGALTPRQTERWWTVSHGVNLTDLIQEVRSDFEAYGLPWLTQFSSVRELAMREIERPTVFDIAARAETGQLLQAQAARARYAIQFGHLQARMKEIDAYLLGEPRNEV